MNQKTLMNRAADNIRILTAAMVEKAKSGHPGGAMGGADFINVLFSEFLIYDPSNPFWEGRDRFYLDPGHMSPMLYSVLAMQGKFTLEDLQQFRQWGSVTPGHPERDIAHGIENTSGPLGQGHTFAAGAAVAEKYLEAHLGHEVMQHKIYAFISDGGIQEEISQGTGRLAGVLGLNNLIMFYDSNDVQLSTNCDVVMREGKTIMAKGAVQADGTSYEGDFRTHGAPLGGDAYINTIKNLGGDVENPFVIYDDVAELYAKRNAELKEIVAKRQAIEKQWAAENPEKAAKMAEWFSGKAPNIDWSNLVQKPNSPTRVASAACLGVLSEQVKNMIVSSADLCNSDRTDGFLKDTHNIIRGDFSGAFFQAGVSELTMACMCIGMYLHGGIIPACGTFFVFSDYMKPAIRMAALMRVPIKFIWSHDAFRVGEDGPTHEPVEQEAQIRLMEKLRNHNGEDSVRVFRPADVNETTVCWQMAMENMNTPTALIFSRQNVDNLPEGTNYDMARKGAYVVAGSDEQYDVILLASGSEVATLVSGASLLRADGVKVRIVSVPSEGLFRRQTKEYQEEVLPTGSKIFGLTAGLPVTLEGLVGSNGEVFGLNSFGYSAPFTVLNEKLGFTAENVYNCVKTMLNK